MGKMRRPHGGANIAGPDETPLYKTRVVHAEYPLQDISGCGSLWGRL